MASIKLLVVVSSLDLRAPLSSTPSWWQLLKALAEQGVELIVTPYHGPGIESPWWTAAPNPCQREGDTVAWLKRFAPPRTSSGDPAAPSVADQLTLELVARITRPRWARHVERLLAANRDVTAVLFVSTPPNHFSGIPRAIEQRFGVPCYFYDGDVPASLPRFAGFRSGFRIYQGADLSEYSAVFSSSRGGVDDLRALGAREVHVLYYGVDPALFAPLDVDEDIDVFFYGHGREYRERWIDAMLAVPSQNMSQARFAVRGHALGDLPRVERLPYASLSALKAYCCGAKVNLLITRQAHTSVRASSTARPFELAALGRAMVSNPYLGIEEWFEPGREVLVVDSADQAIDAYTSLLRDPSTRAELGQRARARCLRDHTYADRARQLLRVVVERTGTTPRAASAQWDSCVSHS